jgi:hypothetical protein
MQTRNEKQETSKLNMDTKQALNRINDSNLELLATYYLRRSDARLQGLISTGINANGQSIPCPVDGFLFIGGDPPQYVTMAATTTAQKELRRKWLGGSKKVGDIEKTATEFRTWRTQEPSAKCKLYLATNRHIEGDIQLCVDAVSLGNQHGIEVEIIEASRLLDFLDNDRDGQYIRGTLLGISADRLSQDLLRQIAYESLTRHKHMFSAEQCPEDSHEITRDAYSTVLKILEQGNCSLIGLRGASGTGKSTLLQQIGENLIKNGEIAIWMPAEYIDSSSSLSNVLLHVLQHFHPALNTQCADDALIISTELPKGLVLLVDDINQLVKPSLAISVIETWSNSTATADDSRSPKRIAVRFIVPIWPAHLTKDSDFTRGGDRSTRSSRWQYIDIDNYSRVERDALAKAPVNGTTDGLLDIINALDGDPFLCGLALQSPPPGPNTKRVGLLKYIITAQIKKAVTKAAEAHIPGTMPSDYTRVLESLLESMLSSDSPSPSWEQLRNALDNSNLALLHILARTNVIGWLDQDGPEERWRWKHERLRDALLGKWLASHVLSQVPNIDPMSPMGGWLADPVLAESWALSLLWIEGTELQISIIEVLKHFQPLALAEALRLKLFADEPVVQHRIATELRTALQELETETSTFVASPKAWLLYKLVETDNPLVLEATEGITPNVYVWAARFRNGDTKAGLDFIGDWLQHHGDFMPVVRDALWEQALNGFQASQQSKRAAIVQELTYAIREDAWSEAVLILAGYLGWPELAEPLCTQWNTWPEEQRLRLLTQLVWLLSRCANAAMQPHLVEALLLVRNLEPETDEETNDLGKDRYWQFMFPLHHAVRWGITADSAETWARVASEHPNLEKTLAYVLRAIDHPAALEAYIRWSAPYKGTFWDEAGETIDPLADDSLFTPTIPRRPESRWHLWKLVQQEADVHTRRLAFRFWQRSATVADLEALQSIAREDELFPMVLRLRLKLRDRTAAPLLIEHMYAEPGEWCKYTPFLVSERGVLDAFFVNFRAAVKDNNAASYLGYVGLEGLPQVALRQLIIRERDLLRASPRLWRSLWRASMPETSAFVKEMMRTAKRSDVRYFFIGNHAARPVAEHMLDALLPALHLFSNHDREQVLELALESGLRGWAFQNLTFLKGNTSKRPWITQKVVHRSLTAAAKAVPMGVDAVYRAQDFFWLTSEERWGHRLDILPTDIMSEVRDWFDGHTGDNARVVVGMVINALGTSSEVEWWAQKKPNRTNSHAYVVWANALYSLRRRRWKMTTLAT